MKELMSDRFFKVMCGIMRFHDMILPNAVRKRTEQFGIEKGMTVVDYACGPGRYAVQVSKLTGDDGEVIAVDIKQIALDKTSEWAKKLGLTNITTRLANGYDSGLESGTADVVFAVDVFHMIEKHDLFLSELRRICKDDGRLILSGGHWSRKKVKTITEASGLWELEKDGKDILRYKKK